jgi:hypothetical protein
LAAIRGDSCLVKCAVESGAGTLPLYCTGHRGSKPRSLPAWSNARNASLGNGRKFIAEGKYPPARIRPYWGSRVATRSGDPRQWGLRARNVQRPNWPDSRGRYQRRRALSEAAKQVLTWPAWIDRWYRESPLGGRSAYAGIKLAARNECMTDSRFPPGNRCTRHPLFSNSLAIPAHSVASMSAMSKTLRCENRARMTPANSSKHRLAIRFQM